MSAQDRCWECRRLVPEEELEAGRDGRPMCCRCRLKESEQKLAEPDRADRPTEVVEPTPTGTADIAVAVRDLPPPEPDQGGWATLY